jgi:hypothetical protein
MGEGPGKGGGTDLTEVTGNSEDTTERLATDSGSGILLAILVVDTDRAGSTVELIVGEGGGYRGNSRGISIIGGLAIGSTTTTGSGMGIDISSPAGGRGTACTSSSAGVRSASSTGSVMIRSTGCITTCSIGSGTAA